MKIFHSILHVVLAGVLALPSLSAAGLGDCGQPTSNGAAPKTSDALSILKAAVGQSTDCDPRPCICDVNGDGKVTVEDALRSLIRAVGGSCVSGCASCSCPPIDYYPCTSAEITVRPGSDFDYGWTGLAHDSEIISGTNVLVRPLSRCTVGGAACTSDEECTQGGICTPTCDCAVDKNCEIAGPTGPRKCFTTLKDCETNADCVAPDTCRYNLGPPLPLVTDGTPVCEINFFDGPIAGSMDMATGELALSTNVRSRVFTGTVPTAGFEAAGGPCPVCGRAPQHPEVGDVFTCDGGQFPGQPCTVEGVSELYGGTSTDCPPPVASNVVGSGQVVSLGQITTGTTTRTAQLPCKSIGFTGNPTTGAAKCLDTGSACTSNADCRRCTGDSSTPCTGETDCTGNGSCAEAPDQPITCGFWCNCGFCNNNPSLPCFETGDCPQGQTCQVGTGSSSAANAPQLKPNNCSSDKFICGQNEDERCATTPTGQCSLKPWLPSCETNTDCSEEQGGFCMTESRPCFEPRISRTGEPSPLGSYCFETGNGSDQCATNLDCNGGAENICIPSSAAPETVALFCVPATASSTINSTSGITGPAAVRLNTFLQVCYCADSVVGCDEECDDGNAVPGDGCDEFCQDE